MATYLSGGYQTTINSTITELFPTLAFNNKKRITTTKAMNDFIFSLADKKKLGTNPNKLSFVDVNDIKSAYKFIDDTSKIRPSMYEEKLSNAVGILKYLYEVNDSRKIDKVIWGYRAKPKGVDDSNHPGDIFIYFKGNQNPKIIGISLKAGTKKSAEPKLNSYVRTTLKKPMWVKAEPGSEIVLKKKLFKEVYSKLPALSAKVTSANWIDISGKNTKPKKEVVEAVLRQFKRSTKKFDELYFKQNKVCREHFVTLINKNFDATKKWIKEEFRLENNTGEKVPLILVKAIGNRAEEQGDKLAKLYPKITKIKARLNSSSVQEWFIDVASTKQKLTLLMTIRSDSEYRESKQQGKLGKYMGLKLLYRGYK
jgi:hypothetical protein